MTIETETSNWQGGLVAVRLEGEWTERPAAFFFDTPGGFGWVEPSYLDPLGAATFAMHKRAGQPQRVGGYYVWRGPDELLEIFEADPDNDSDHITHALDWYMAHLRAMGTTPAQERERLRAEVPSLFDAD